MGYNTRFSGQLDFVEPLSAEQTLALSKLLGEDCRDHPEWEADLYSIDLRVTADGSGLQWDGSEKTYEMEKLVNVVLRQMRLEFPSFGLTGTLLAQGEEVSDRWALVIGEDGWAHKREVAAVGRTVICPHCGEHFSLEGAKP